MEKLDIKDRQIKSIQYRFKSDIRSMINYIQSNHYNLHDITVMIDDAFWEELIVKFKTNDIETIKHFISETSDKYNIQYITLIKQFINYLLKENHGYKFAIIENEFGWLKMGEYVLLIIMTILIPAILYFFGTPGGRKERIFSTSVFITAGMFILSTLLFGVYINTFSNYNELYGSIGALLIMMLYIWVNSVILLLGFELKIILNGLKKAE